MYTSSTPSSGIVQAPSLYQLFMVSGMMSTLGGRTGTSHANSPIMDPHAQHHKHWLADKRVLITGATGGIGRALVEELIKYKPRLLLLGRQGTTLAHFKKHAGIDFLKTDLNSHTNFFNIVQWIKEHWGSLDVLIHNAASEVTPLPISQLNQQEILDTMQVGPVAGLELIRTLSPLMPKGSRIILSSSAAGFSPFHNSAAYCAAKWSMEGLCKASALDLWSVGISVNTVVPPATKTSLSRPHFDKEVFDQFPEPEEILEPYIYLLSTASERVSGQSLFYQGPRGQVDRTIPPLKVLHCTQAPMRPPTRAMLQEQGVTVPMAKVDLGEAPFPPSKKIEASVQRWMQGMHTEEYPDASAQPLRYALAQHHQLHPDQILIGAGSSEILAWLLDELVSPGDEVICPYPCFSLFRWMTTFRGLKTINIENTTACHNLIEMLSKVGPATRLIYLDSPSNPLGDVIDAQTFSWFLKRLPPHIWVVVDHAYQDFIYLSNGLNTTSEAILSDPRILSVRTLSKSHALAAWRIGYLCAHAQSIKQLLSGITPFTVSSASQVAALAAIEDVEHTTHIKTFYIKERTRLFQCLDALEIPHWKGETSFVSVYWPNVENYFERAAKNGIALSKMEYDSLFVSAIRDPKTNDRVIAFLEKYYPVKAVQESLLAQT